MNKLVTCNLKSMGIFNLNQMQSSVFDAVYHKRNTIFSSPTGSGKTIAYLAPLISRILNENLESGKQSPLVIIISPFKTLNYQIMSVLTKLTWKSGLKSALFPFPVGGIPSSFHNTSIIISTPASITNLKTASSKILFNSTTSIVFDEADYIFDSKSGARLLKMIPKSIQKICVGATLHKDFKNSRQFQDFNVFDASNELQPIPSTIKECVLDIPKEDQLDYIKSKINSKRHLIFTNTSDSATKLYNSLAEYGIDNLHCINGSKSIHEKLDILALFATRKDSVIVCTDSTSRGLDFNGVQVDSVWNYDYPKNTTDYIHRVGRTGRNGMNGQAFVFTK